MADHKKWFKVWTTILIDEVFEDLDDRYIGIWTRLGARTALVGIRGSVRFKNMQKLIDFLRVESENEALKILDKLPNVSLNVANNVQKSGKKSANNVQKNTLFSEYDEVTVTIKNWVKYQEDSTAAERQRKSRSKKRGEEKRGEESINSKKKELIARYCELFKERYKENPYITGKEAGMAGRLIEIPDVYKILESFFESDDKFIIENRHGFNIIESQINKLKIQRQETEPSPPYFKKIPRGLK